MSHRVIFTADDVRAYMAGRKTQFRRVVKLPKSINPDEYGEALWDLALKPDGSKPGEYVFIDRCHPTESYPWIVKCPFGVPGDRLWVAETWYNDVPGDECRDYIAYRATHRCSDWEAGCPCRDALGRSLWRASTTMPRWACRLKPEVTEIRVERVQSITQEDCWADGIVREFDAEYLSRTKSPAHAAFATLWDATNAKHGHAWDLNEWVWAVTVKPYEEGKTHE